MELAELEPPTRVYPGQMTVLTCADQPVWQLSDEQIDWDLAALDRDLSRLVARRVQLLAEAVSRGLPARTLSSRTPERWLRDAHRVATTEAVRRLREADTLVARPVVLAAMADGRVTVEQAAVICRSAAALELVAGASAEDRDRAVAFLVEQCSALDPRGLARLAEELVETLTARPSVDDPADAAAVAKAERAAERAAQQDEHNSLQLRTRPDGSVTGRFRFTPESAAVVKAWLRQADTKHPGEGDFADQRQTDERRGDHLVATMAHACRTGVDHTRPVHAKVVVTMPLDALRRGLAGAGTLDTGGTLSAAAARRLACAAGIVPAVLGGESEVLDLGRTRRAFSTAQKCVFRIRDRGCIAPGCDRSPAACDGHHQTEWTDGGPTDIANGSLLCEFHHQQVHRQGWQVVLAANGFPALIPPVSIDPQRRPRQHHRFHTDEVIRRRRT
jgi:hypothetical protein